MDVSRWMPRSSKPVAGCAEQAAVGSTPIHSRPGAGKGERLVSATIVVLGSFNLDMITTMERLPQPGETVQGRRFSTGPGGKGSNQAVAAARLGADVSFVGRIGQDPWGDVALTCWQEEGVNSEHVGRDAELATGVAPIWVDDAGENAIVCALGANLGLTREHVDAAVDRIAAADILVLQLEVPLETVAHALNLAQKLEVPCILNPAPAQTLTPEMLALASWLTPNETELATLYGEAPNDLRPLVTRRGQTLIQTMGAAGARWATQDGSGQVPAFEVEVLDTTGAGDAFNGGLAVALAEGQALEEALRFANAVAALSVTRPGTAPAMPRRADVEALLAGG